MFDYISINKNSAIFSISILMESSEGKSGNLVRFKEYPL